MSIVKEISDNGYIFSGEEHQNASTGVPILEDGSCFRASMRSWGIIMSAAYPTISERATNYMDFYMSTPSEANLPELSDINIEPSKSNYQGGFMSPEDNRILSDALSSGIPLLTTDKVLSSVYNDIIKNKK